MSLHYPRNKEIKKKQREIKSRKIDKRIKIKIKYKSLSILVIR